MSGLDLANLATVDDVREALQAVEDWTAEYYEEDSDNPIADFVSWGWREGDTDAIWKRLKQVDFPKACATFEALSSLSGGDAVCWILDKAEPEPVRVSGWGYRRGLVDYAPMGEVETQLPDELSDAIEALPSEDVASLERDFCMRRVCGRWYMYVYLGEQEGWALEVSEADIESAAGDFANEGLANIGVYRDSCRDPHELAAFVARLRESLALLEDGAHAEAAEVLREAIGTIADL